MFLFACMGLTFGITPLVGELFARNDKIESAKYLQNGVALFSAIGFVAMVMQFAITPLMYHMGQPQEVVDAAIPFYRTIITGMIPVMIFFVFKQFLEGTGTTKVAT